MIEFRRLPLRLIREKEKSILLRDVWQYVGDKGRDFGGVVCDILRVLWEEREKLSVNMRFGGCTCCGRDFWVLKYIGNDAFCKRVGSNKESVGACVCRRTCARFHRGSEIWDRVNWLTSIGFSARGFAGRVESVAFFAFWPGGASAFPLGKWLGNHRLKPANYSKVKTPKITCNILGVLGG